MPPPPSRKPLFILHGAIKSPPFTPDGRQEAGELLRRVQEGEKLSFPQSRPLPSVGPRCHEIRVRDADHVWRIVYRIDKDAILVASIFSKKGKSMQQRELGTAEARLTLYDSVNYARGANRNES